MAFAGGSSPNLEIRSQSSHETIPGEVIPSQEPGGPIVEEPEDPSQEPGGPIVEKPKDPSQEPGGPIVEEPEDPSQEPGGPIVEKPEDPSQESGEPALDIFEDLSQELEDFVYLWRLGCIDEALKLYKARLQEHQYKHFPILVEFVDALLDQGLHEVIQNTLSDDRIDHFDLPDQRATLVLMRELNTDGMRRTMLSGPGREGNSRVVPIYVELSAIESLLDGITTDKFDSVMFHLHELALWKILLATRLTANDRKLLAPFYKRCCKVLIGNSRYWEAFRLIRIITRQSAPSSSLSCFRTFFNEITQEPLHATEEFNQPAGIAYLAGLIEYLDYIEEIRDVLDEAVDEGVLKPQNCIDKANLLFEHFFEKLGNAKGILFRTLMGFSESYEFLPSGRLRTLSNGGGWGVRLTKSEQQSINNILHPGNEDLIRTERTQ